MRRGQIVWYHPNEERKLKGRVVDPHPRWPTIQLEDGELVNADAGQLSQVLRRKDGSDRRRGDMV